MNIVKLLFVATASMGLCLTAAAQGNNIWTLQNCIDYAIENNIDMQKRQIDIKSQESILKETKLKWLPDLNANIGNDFNFGNVYASSGLISPSNFNEDLYFLSGNIRTKMPLFNGLAIYYQRWSEESKLEAATQNREQAKKDLTVMIAAQYFQVLYYQGIADISKSQVELSEELVTRAAHLVDEGKSPQSELIQSQSQLAAYKYQQTMDEGNVTLALLQLTQLMNLESPENLELSDSEFKEAKVNYNELIDVQSLYDEVVMYFPGILASEAQLKASEYDMKVSKSQFYPKITLNASIQTYYYNLFTDNPMVTELPFAEALVNNNSKLVGVSLSIPIFNRTKTRQEVNRAMMEIDRQRLELENVKQNLRKEIQEAYYNAYTAAKRYESALMEEESANISFQYELKRYEAGKSTVFELNQFNQKWLKAKQDVILDKYDFLIRKKILEFYNSRIILN